MNTIVVRIFSCIILILSSEIVIGQINCTNGLPSIGNAPCCYEPWDSGFGVVGCYNADEFALIFDDEFTGDAIDLSKWFTSKQSGVHGGTTHIDYDNGRNFQFRHPGIALIDSCVSSFSAPVVDYYPDTASNYRTWSYTSSELSSQYQFPSSEINAGPQVGIYVLDAILPSQGTSGPYSTSSGNKGMIWPAYWMWGEVTNDYGEIDGFEFPNSQYEDIQTVHAPTLQNQCAITVDPGSIAFGDGSEHTYYTMYSILSYIASPPHKNVYGGEVDFFVDNTETRYDAAEYFVFPDGAMYPINCSDVFTKGFSSEIKNINRPNLTMWLMVDCWVQSPAQPSYFPLYFYIKSIKYYEPLSCSAPNTMTATSPYFSNSHNFNFNYIGGSTVTIDGTTDGPINIPLKRQGTNCPGNLEALALNQVIVKGAFADSGYLVLKASANVCNNYSGPMPDYDISHRPIKNGGEDTIIGQNSTFKRDSVGSPLI